MAGLNLSYCQLIKIILSQIGGNPLQQVYSQLSQGSPQIIAKSGIIPQGLSELKALVEQVTAAINEAQQLANDFNDTMERINGSFFQNPLGTVIDGTTTITNTKISTANTRIASIDAMSADPPGPTITPRTGFADIAADRADLVAEVSALTAFLSTMTTYKTNTDRLTGLSPQSGSAIAGGCSLQDLLGSACSPNNDVPDIDLKALVDSLKNGDAIAAIKEKLTNATGFADYTQALATFKASIDTVNVNFKIQVNKAAIRSAIQSQLTQIVYNLLTGCGGQVYDLMLKSNVKSTLAVYATAIQAQQDSGSAYFGADGNVVNTSSVVVTPVVSGIVVSKEI
jgi:hypothetical protein